MKAIMIMFDSLNKRMLPNYGCDWIHAPNFNRLSDLTVTFDNFYAGSLPCIPARRELHTGRYNFLHRSWGPLEPFDVSMVELLKKHGMYTHLTTDHNHYFEDGGATYHNRYNSWEFVRGQEGDHWKGHVKDPNIPESVTSNKLGDLWRQDWINRQYMDSEEKHPLKLTFEKGIEFIHTNKDASNWFLQIEAFDPHEPFFTHKKYKDLYPHQYEGRHFDWPDYGKVAEQPEEVQHVIFEYASLVSMCDEYLGKVIDLFDLYDLWKDTLLIVNTDHGFMLGEKEWWGKNIQPFYNEIVNVPFFIWDPRYGVKGERSDTLVQTIDIAPTLLDFFNVTIPDDVQGKPLGQVIQSKKKIREAALFGAHGGHINITDGKYVYMKAPVNPDNKPLYEYTLMPTHMHNMFSMDELSDIELSEPFTFTKGNRVMKIGASTFLNPYLHGTLLFDLESDPLQNQCIEDFEIEVGMIKKMADLMRESDAPIEQFERVGIPKNGVITSDEIKKQKETRDEYFNFNLGLGEVWNKKGKTAFLALLNLTPKHNKQQIKEFFKSHIQQKGIKEVTEQKVLEFVDCLGENGEKMQTFPHLFVN
ncbi:sulfatase [Heyndrickxia sp. NPDC080065]|uniref:sulfatase n=1 Tax=Heyndrickxia sp. NPDC080065 TaxID=3390568 RepID=UPI003D0681FD